MRPVQYKNEDIIQAGLELQALGRKVSGFSLQQRVLGGNTKRLKQVWDEYLASQAVSNTEPATKLPNEIAEAVTVVAKVLNERLLGFAIELNDKAVKAAERRVKEDISSANEQREQAERELSDAQALIQSQTLELTKLQERLALTEQSAKMEREQYSAELESLRNELLKLKHANEILMAKIDEANKQTAITREEAPTVNGQFEATKASTSEPMRVHYNQRTEIMTDRLYDINPDAFRFGPK